MSKKNARARAVFGQASKPVIESLEKRVLLSTTTYLSDLSWASATSGWETAQKDASVNGNTITLNSVTYSKGLGVNSVSDITYDLAGNYSEFLSDVGVDDEESTYGSVNFQVYADDTKIFDSGTMTPSSTTQSLDLDVTGVETLDLRVTDGGDDIDYDHGDWAGARVVSDTPTAPSGLTTVATSASEIDLAWTDNSDDETGFIIDRSTDGTTFTELDTVDANVTSYSDTGLTANTAYYYRVRATNSAGDSSNSNTANSNTLASSGSATYLSDLDWTSATSGWETVEQDASVKGNTITLNGVTYDKGLGANSVSDIIYDLGGSYSRFLSDVGVDDEETSDGSVNFQVYADDTKIFDSGTMTPTSATQAIDLSVAGVETLDLRMTDGGDGIDFDHGDWAGARLINPPEAPSGLVAAPNSSSQIDLSWIDNSIDETDFVIERSIDGTDFTQLATVDSDVTSYSDADLVSNTAYYYRVRATNAAGDSSNSNIANTNTSAASGTAIYLSDLSWESTPTNGWGPVEKDMSNGGESSDDGNTITLNGVTYTKGLGVNSVSDITYDLGGSYSRFLSEVGIDDEEHYNGSVVFQVFADGTKIFDSGVMGPDSATQSLNLDVSGVDTLELHVTDGGDDSDYDHGDWAGARLVNPPAVPTGLTATGTYPTEIHLQWNDNFADETGVKIEESLDGTTFTQIGTAAAIATSYDASGLTEGTTYYFRIAAIRPSGTTGYSDVASGRTLLAQPTGLQAVASSSTQIDLTWNDLSAHETGYEVAESTDDVTFTTIDTLGANAESYSATGLTPGTQYYFKVRAIGSSTQSSYSFVDGDVTPASDASALTVNAVSATDVSLSWTDPSDGSDTWIVLRSDTKNGTYTTIATLDPGTTTFDDTSTEEDSKYWYKVAGLTEDDEQEYTSALKMVVTPLSDVDGLTATVVSPYEVHLAWTNHSEDASWLKVEESTDGETFSEVQTLTSDTTEVTIDGLEPDTDYTFRISDYSPYNNGRSGTATASTPSATLSQPKVVFDSSTSTTIAFHWTESSADVSSYVVESTDDGINYTTDDTLSADVTSDQLTDLTQGTAYGIRVRAIGTGDPSAGNQTISDPIWETAEVTDFHAQIAGYNIVAGASLATIVSGDVGPTYDDFGISTSPLYRYPAWLNVDGVPLTVQSGLAGFNVGDKGFSNIQEGTEIDLTFGDEGITNGNGQDLVIFSADGQDPGSGGPGSLYPNERAFELSTDDDDFTSSLDVDTSDFNAHSDDGSARAWSGQYSPGGSIVDASGTLSTCTIDLSALDVLEGDTVHTIRIRSLDPESDFLGIGVLDANAPIALTPTDDAAKSADPVRYFDGVAQVQTTDLSSDGFGQAWGMSRTWDNGGQKSGTSVVGNGWTVTQMPSLVPAAPGSSTLAVVDGDNSHEYFDYDGSTDTYVARANSLNTLDKVAITGGYEYVETTPQGDAIRFTDFSSTNPVEQGQFKSITDASGGVISVVSHTSDGRIQEVQQTSSGGITNSYLYTYLSSGDVNAGLLSNVTLRRGSSASGPWTTVQQVAYDYYQGTDATADQYGNIGDLRTATIEDGSSNVIDMDYYRYYVPDEANGYTHGLKYAFEAEAYARLTAALPEDDTPFTATDSQVAAYADYSFQYDSGQRVTLQTIAGFGGSSTGGQGTYQFSYETPSTAATASGDDDYNTWKYETIETLPGGTTQTGYTNAFGQAILQQYEDAESNDWDTYSKYDDNGRVIEVAGPSAVSGFTAETDGTFTPDINANGTINLTDYYSETSDTISETVAGGVAGYVEDTKVANGSDGLASPVLLGTIDYFKRTVDGESVFPVADQTIYRNTDGTGDETTHESYTWYTGTLGIQSEIETLPIILTSENGPDTVDQQTIYFDSYGRPIWTQDGDGYLNYTAYDDGTGAVVQSLQGVDTSADGAPTEPSSFVWPVTVQNGPNLETTMVVDDLGRTITTTTPAGRITYTVYMDLNGVHETRVYPGWDASTDTTTAPVEVTRDDPADDYAETFSFVPADDSLANPPDGTEAVTNLQSLSISRVNAAAQVTETDQYFDLSGLSYSTAAILSGAIAGTNYYATQYGYDAEGRQNHVVAPTGTITNTVFDGLGRLVSTSVGTNDTTSNNMVTVSSDEYDNGETGDGNLTKVTAYPGGDQPARVTQFYYDWRDRQVATKSGVQSEEDTSTNRPLTFKTYDNLDEPIEVKQFDGDGVTITSIDGVPNAPSSSLLRADSTTAYDDQGRPYLTETYGIDPTTGSISSTALTTNTFYDHNGNVIEIISPSGLVTKNQYDGAGRLIETAQTDGAGGTAWSDAGGLADDNVLSETLMQYDGDGNVVLTTTKQRFHDETSTGELGDATAAPLARVSYVADYYDAAGRLTKSVNLGTNGGSAFTYDPDSPPTRSDDALTIDYSYNDAGLLDIETDPLGIETKTLYDALGRNVITIADYTDGTPTDSSNQTTIYTYDGDGHVVTMTAVMPTGTSSQTTQYVYGVSGDDITSNDLLATVEYPDATTGSASTLSSNEEDFTYNALGETTSENDRNGNVHSYSYDVLGRQTSDAVTTLGSGVDGSVRRIDTAYNSAGQAYLFTSYADTSGTTVVNQVEDLYNGLGQLIAEYQSNSGTVSTESTPQVDYSYSSPETGSRPTSMTYPDGRTIDYNYASGIDDTIGRLTSLSDTGGTLESYTYLGLDTVVERAHPQNDTALTYIGTGTGDGGDQYTGLDRFGRVVDQKWINTSTSDIIDEDTYTYDADGNALTDGNALSSDNSESFGFDDLNRLTSFAVGTSGTTQSWDLDSVGNWNSVTTDGTTTDRTNNSQNQISTNGSSTLAYDNAGDETTDQNGGTLTYDAWGQLRSYTPSGGSAVYYGYDAMGRRVYEDSSNSDGSDSSATHLYYSAAGQVIQEAGTQNRENVWSPVYVNAPVERDDTDGSGTSTQRLYAEQDANWNMTSLTNSSGEVVERYRFDPYGTVTVMDASFTPVTGNTSAYGIQYLFQGGRLDSASQLYHFGARDYDPALGRWIEQDPSGYPDGPNRYLADASDPTGATDPSGLNAIDDNGTSSTQPNKIWLRDPFSIDPNAGEWIDNPGSLDDLKQQLNNLEQDREEEQELQREREQEQKQLLDDIQANIKDEMQLNVADTQLQVEAVWLNFEAQQARNVAVGGAIILTDGAITPYVIPFIGDGLLATVATGTVSGIVGEGAMQTAEIGVGERQSYDPKAIALSGVSVGVFKGVGSVVGSVVSGTSSAAENAVQDTVPGYRAVSQAEWDQIQRTSEFSSPPYASTPTGNAGKWFYGDQTSAQQFGNSMSQLENTPYGVVQAQVPRSSITFTQPGIDSGYGVTNGTGLFSEYPGLNGVPITPVTPPH